MVSRDKTKVIAVMPAYNEEKHIEKVIKNTKKYVYKLIVVDDGSKDNTYAMAKKHSDIALRHIINMGKGLALKTGIETALIHKPDVIVTIDSDGQNLPEDIPRLVKTLTENNLDLVIGSRPRNKNMPTLMKLGNHGLYKIFKFLFKLNIYDTQSGFRAFKAKVYPKIRWGSTGYAIETEMLAKAGKNKLKCGEVPIQTIYLDDGKGTTPLDGFKIFLKMLYWKIWKVR